MLRFDAPTGQLVLDGAQGVACAGRDAAGAHADVNRRAGLASRLDLGSRSLADTQQFVQVR